MAEKQVWVVTNPELGWDCVCAVYEREDDISKRYIHDDTYVIHQTTIKPKRVKK